MDGAYVDGLPLPRCRMSHRACVHCDQWDDCLLSAAQAAARSHEQASSSRPLRAALQGNCTGMPDKAVTPPLPSLIRKGQCVLFTPFDLFFFVKTPGHNVWLDRLILRTDRAADISTSTVVYWDTPTTGAPSRLYMTRMTVQCDGKPGCQPLFLRGQPAYAAGARRAATDSSTCRVVLCACAQWGTLEFRCAD
jgi:hypothetical protein